MNPVFTIVKANDGTWAVVTHASSHYHFVKAGLTKERAEWFCEILNRMVSE